MICKNCSKENPDNVNFCNACGANLNGESADAQGVAQTANPNYTNEFEQEQKCLDMMVRMTKYQSVAYKISAIVLTVITAIYCLVYIGMGLAAAFSGDNGAAFVGVVFFMVVLFVLISMIPVLIFNYVMANKTASYYKNAYQDCTLSVNHLGNVGSIVIAGIFNSIALVFEIIGFVQVKTNKDVIERIKMRQGV